MLAMVIKKEHYIIIYFFTLLILLLDATGLIPGTSVLRKIKYIYILFLLLFTLKESKKINIHISIVLSILPLHTFVFGIFLKKEYIAYETTVHVREMCIYFCMIFLTAYMVYKTNSYIKFLKYTYISLALFLLFMGVTHFGDFVNPLYYGLVFINGVRIRSGFGLDVNGTANFCVCALVFSYILRYEFDRMNIIVEKNKGILWMCTDVIIVCMLFSTASRTSILSLIIFFVFSVLIDVNKTLKILLGTFRVKLKIQFKKQQIRNLIIILICATILMAGLNIKVSDDFMQNTNRSENWEVNYPIFIDSGSLWTGMGFIESSAFYNDGYGYDTWPVDNYYLYILFSTGIIGSFIMLFVLLYLLIYVLKCEFNNQIGYLFPLYIMLMFAGMGEVNLITYRFMTSTYYMSLILYYLFNGLKGADLNEIEYNNTGV